MTLPLCTPNLGGTRGTIGTQLEDFQVVEEPAYAPQGEGSHCFVRLRKTGTTSHVAVKNVARALGIRDRDIGMAGLKDRWAVTEQWLSIPGVLPAQVLALELPDIQILEAVLHPNKLRTGHLRGNHFKIRLVGVVDQGAERAGEVLTETAQNGFFHYFGPQRFGHDGQSAVDGKELILGRRKCRDRRIRRLLISALQADLFNRYLVARCALASLAQPLPGELVQKTDSGGSFVVEDVQEVADRMSRGEVVPTGPLFGPKMPRPEGQALALEEQVLQETSLSLPDFVPWRSLAPGGRRPLLVRQTLWGVDEVEPHVLDVHFHLPSGSYATVLLREITKTPFDRLRPREPGAG